MQIDKIIAVCFNRWRKERSVMTNMPVSEMPRSKVSADPEIRRFQRNLETLRKLAGWSADQLGEKVNLSKQTIRNMEAIDPKAEISAENYIKLRKVLEAEANSRAEQGDQLLRQAIDVLLNAEEPEEVEEREEQKNRELIQTVAKARKGGAKSTETRTVMLSLFPKILSGAAILVGGAWLTRFLAKKWGD